MYVSAQQTIGRSSTRLAAPRPVHAEPLAAAPHVEVADLVDTWGQDSFPASDPPSNW